MAYEQKDAISAIREGRLYDYVANHYWEMPKEDLKDIALELIWNAEKCLVGKGTLEDLEENLISDLRERWDMDGAEKEE